MIFEPHIGRENRKQTCVYVCMCLWQPFTFTSPVDPAFLREARRHACAFLVGAGGLDSFPCVDIMGFVFRADAVHANPCRRGGFWHAGTEDRIRTRAWEASSYLGECSSG